MRNFLSSLRIHALMAFLVLTGSTALAADGSIPGLDPALCASTPTGHGQWTPPEPIERKRIRYPARQENTWSEGWVLLLVTVREDGSVGDITVTDSVGSDAFRQSTIEGVKKWRFKPAKLRGEPIESYGYTLFVIYAIADLEKFKGWHPSVVKKHNQALELLNDGKPNEAIEVLKRAFDVPASRFEQAMVSWLLTRSYMRLNNRSEALIHARHATINEGNSLDPSVVGPALAIRIVLEAQDGNVADALCIHQDLEKQEAKWRTEEGGAPIAKAVDDTIAKLKAAVAGPTAISVAGRIVMNEDAGEANWLHTMVRRRFLFDDVQGPSARFKLLCDGLRMEEQISTEMEWTIPAEAGRCTLIAFGKPGTTFNFIER